MPVIPNEITPEIMLEMKQFHRRQLDRGEFDTVREVFVSYLHFEAYKQLQALKEAVDEYNMETGENYELKEDRTWTEVLDDIIERAAKELL